MNLSLWIIALALYPPIPKGAGAYEGQIACMVTSPTKMVLVIRPDGKETLRLPMDGINGNVTALRQARRGEFAIIESLDDNGQQQIYKLELKAGAKATLLEETKNSQTTWAISGDGKFAYYSEIDGNDKYVHYKHDLEKGKREELKLQGDFVIEDFAQATDDLILCHQQTQNGRGDSGSALVSVKTGKAVYTAKESMGSRCISQDGKWILNSAIRRENGRAMSQLECFEIANGRVTPIAFPDGKPVSQNCFSCSADSKGACYVADGTKLYVADLEKKTAKLIYTAEQGMNIADCDWR